MESKATVASTADVTALQAPPIAVRHQPPPPRVVIRPECGWAPLDLAGLWQARELIYYLTARDLRARYKQSVLGIFWVVLQPILTALAFTVFFATFGRLGSDGIPAPIFYLAALVPWTLFANALGGSMSSLVSSASLMKKVYFPRLVLPIVGAVGMLIDFVAGFLVLLLAMACYGRMPAAEALYIVPFLAAVTLILALGLGLWTSALHVQYRDVGRAVKSLIHLWMFASPVIYSVSIVPAEYRTVYASNPMCPVIDAFRECLFGIGHVPGTMLGVAALTSVALLVSGAWFFKRQERSFVDAV